MDAALEQDERSRREALDVRRSMLLQAPAGSGKTTVLTARYLALLGTVDAPEEILAITFTRKAAAEMRQRVLEALRKAGTGEPIRGIAAQVLQAAGTRDRERRWNLLSNPSRLRIETIDALNYWLACQLPIASRSSPGLQIARDPIALYRRAARRCLESAASEPEIEQAADVVFERLDNSWERVEDRLTRMLEQRLHWLPRVLGPTSEQLVERIESSLDSTLRAALAAPMALLSPGLLRESEFMLSHSLRMRRAPMPDGGVQLSGEPRTVAQWRGFAGLALTESGWRKNFTVTNGFPAEDKDMKARVKDWIEALAKCDGAQTALAAVRELPDYTLSQADREALRALAALMIRAVGELEQVFAASGQVDFTYISGAARQALVEEGEPTDLALRTGAAVRHLLVDEFQDTSFDQLELLRALTAGWEPGDGHTLFVVGDPMQSIYQFREAEVGLFLRARDHGVGDTILEGLELRQNFRSRAPLIEWINQQFSTLFPRRDDARLAEIRYLSSIPGPKQINYDGPAVALHSFMADDWNGEAECVVQIVREARRRDSAASIAILVAARQHASRIVARLGAAGLVVRGVNLEPLNERSVVQDLSALTRCLLHGADRTAWLAVLRAPWCGLTLAELQALQFGEHGDLFAVLQAHVQNLSEPERLQRLCTALAPAITGAERGIALWQRVERCWLRLGGPSIYTAQADRLDARRFIDALAQHEAPDSLAGEALGEITKRLYSSSVPKAGAIDVLTMHGAKGLEWDVVILPGLGRKTASTPDRLMHWIELPRAGSGTDLLLAPIRATDKEPQASLAGYIKQMRRQRIDSERVRLLYVAATRAKKALHLLGGLKPPVNGREVTPQTGSLLAVLWRTLKPQFQEQFAGIDIDAATTPTSLTEFRTLQRLPDHWRLRPQPGSPSIQRLSLASPAPSDAPEYSWVGLTARAIGTVVHAELRRLAGGSAQTIDDGAAEEPDYETWLRELGVGATELATATANIREALRRTLSDERGRWLLHGAHREAHSEWRLTGMHQGRVVNVIFDRMLVDEQGQRWVIDYKTSTHEGGAVQEFVDSEAQRYLPQMQRYARLAAQIGQTPVRVALYFPLLGIFRELPIAA